MTFAQGRPLNALRHAIRFGLFFLLVAAPLFAQEGEPSPADSTTGWVFRWLNFAIVLAALIWALSKAGPYFRSHADEISERIAEGTRAREAAEQKRREAQAKLAGIETEVAAIRTEAKRSTQAETERLRATAKSEAEAIERAAQAEISAAERAANLELKALAARIAVERAEAVLRQEITPQAESALFRTFVAELERSAN
ncbi:MAG: ATP synthase F0 subunit B [Candidatus Acidiferrales bacterium]|jgi:F-type H+-transporting ATPase subunit b